MTRRRARTLTTVLLGAMAIGGAVVAVWHGPGWIARLVYAAETGRAAAAREQLAIAHDFSDAFASVADVLRPSVVSITSVTRVRPRNPQDPRGQRMPEEFRRFFGDGDTFGRFPFELPEGGLEQRGQGSGEQQGGQEFLHRGFSSL